MKLLTRRVQVLLDGPVKLCLLAAVQRVVRADVPVRWGIGTVMVADIKLNMTDGLLMAIGNAAVSDVPVRYSWSVSLPVDFWADSNETRD